MTNKGMIILECIGGGIVAGAIANFIDNAISKKSDLAKKTVDAEMAEASKKVTKQVAEVRELMDEIDAQESKRFAELMDEREPIDISKKIDELHDDLEESIKRRKIEISFDERIKDIESESEKEFKEALKDMDYYKQRNDITRTIDRAEREYKVQAKAIDLAGGDDDTVKALKKTAKKAKNAVIDDQKSLLSDLDAEYEVKRKEILKDRKAKIKEVRDELNGLTKEDRIAYEKARKDILEKHDIDVAEVRKIVKDERSEETKQIIENSAKVEHEYEAFKAEYNNKVDEIADNITSEDAIVSFLKEKKISKGTVIFVAALPFVPVVHLGYLYFKRVKSILDRM